MRGGRHVECTVCKDVFPCRTECGHFDCIQATGRQLPDWVTCDTDSPAVEATADA